MQTTIATQSFPWTQSLWQQWLQLGYQRFPHALLLTGMAGLGKYSLLQQLAQYLLCEHAFESEQSCGQCHNCRLMLSGNHPDYLWIDVLEGKKQISIEQIRELIERCQHTGQISERRVFIINQADKMSIAAANALLKTLEEPGQGVHILLSTSLTQQLPMTIRSRCQQHKLAMPKASEASSWLQQQVSTDAQSVNLALLFSRGAPLAALDLINDNESLDLTELMGQWLALAKQEIDPIAFSQQYNNEQAVLVMCYFYDFLSALAKAPYHSLTLLSLAQSDVQQLMQTDQRQLFLLMDDIVKAQQCLRTNVNAQLLLQSVLFQWARLF